MLSLQIDDARLSDLEPWHAEQLAGLFRAHGSDFYDWLPWEGFEDVEGARGFLESFATGTEPGAETKIIIDQGAQNNSPIDDGDYFGQMNQ